MGKAEKVGKPVERERKGMWGSVAIGVLVGLLVLLLGTFLAVLFSGYAEILIVQLLRVEQSETEGSQKYQALKFLGIGMGGMLLALQALIANKRAKAMENTATAQLEANQATGRGQRQERMKNAIEHLGNDRDSVRLGGAYELFHLAEDTKDSGQRQTVLDILCAHIRWTTREPKYRDKHQSKPSEEIQSLLTLLFVQRRKVFTGLDINLEGSLLNGSNLSQARLEKAALARAELHGANLEGARLSGADLFGARLSGAHLSGAQLHGANLRGARLPEADFGDAQLHGANLTGAQLHGAYLWGAELHGAYLEGAQLHGAYLTDVQLPGGTLTGAQLHGASSDLKGLPESFEASINERIDEESNLSRTIFAGGLTQEDVDSIGKDLSEGGEILLRKRLEAHIGKPASYGLPEDSGAITGAYTKEEAAQWIAEYKTAMSAVSGSG